VTRTGSIEKALKDIHHQYDIQNIFAHEETGNSWTYKRDLRVHDFCLEHDIEFQEFPTNGAVRRLKNRDDWVNIRNDRMVQPVIPKPVSINTPAIEKGNIPNKADKLFGADLNGIVQVGGRKAGIEILKSFLTDRGEKYLYHISAPGLSEHHSSRLSAHLTWGTLSMREVVQAVERKKKSLSLGEKKPWARNLSAFSSRLAWHCHFIQKMEDQPEIEFQCMHPAYEGLREPYHNEEYFEAWKTGQTGYPFIDACMRNLIHNGWITFRMRAMLVSFASYHLWLDWRKTAPYMATLFTDYEPGIHYSQFQMQSGVTGINIPRMYNPIKQSKDQDSTGVFIKKWVPELREISEQFIHEPWRLDVDLNYPKPIVDHGVAISQARKRLASVRKESNFKENAKKVYNKLGSRKRPSVRHKSIKEDNSQLSLL